MEGAKRQSIIRLRLTCLLGSLFSYSLNYNGVAKEVTLPTCTENLIFVPKFWAMIGSINEAPSSKVQSVPCPSSQYQVYRKITKISPGACIFQRPFLRGLSTEGNMRFKIDWASLIVGSKFTVFALFYFVFEGNFPSTSTWRAYIWRGDLTEGFLRYEFGGHIFGGAYTWRGLFSEFYGISKIKWNLSSSVIMFTATKQ